MRPSKKKTTFSFPSGGPNPIEYSCVDVERKGVSAFTIHMIWAFWIFPPYKDRAPHVQLQITMVTNLKMVPRSANHFLPWKRSWQSMSPAAHMIVVFGWWESGGWILIMQRKYIVFNFSCINFLTIIKKIKKIVYAIALCTKKNNNNNLS